MAWVSAATVAVVGLAVLGLGRLAPPVAGGPVAVIVAPWEVGGMRFAASVGLPIIDITWGGHLVTFDTSSNPRAIDGLGLWAIAASASGGCTTRI